MTEKEQENQDGGFKVLDGTEFNETKANITKAKRHLSELMDNFDAMSILLEYRAKCAKKHFDSLIKEEFTERQALDIVTNTKY